MEGLQEAMAALKKRPGRRSPHDLELLSSLLSSVEFFKEDNAPLHCIAQYLNYSVFEKDQDIIEQYSNSEAICLILKGSVAILIPDKYKVIKGQIVQTFKELTTISAGNTFLLPTNTQEYTLL